MVLWILGRCKQCKSILELIRLSIFFGLPEDSINRLLTLALEVVERDNLNLIGSIVDSMGR